VDEGTLVEALEVDKQLLPDDVNNAQLANVLAAFERFLLPYITTTSCLFWLFSIYLAINVNSENACKTFTKRF